VPHPAAHARHLRPVAARLPVPHALHTARHEHATAHYLSGRRSLGGRVPAAALRVARSCARLGLARHPGSPRRPTCLGDLYLARFAEERRSPSDALTNDRLPATPARLAF